MDGETWAGLAAAGVTAAYALFSRRLAASPVSSAMVFVGCGVLLGPAVLGVVDLGQETGPVRVLIEAALALVLFTDALAVRLRDLRSGGFVPARLLGVGLPLTIRQAGSWRGPCCPG